MEGRSFSSILSKYSFNNTSAGSYRGALSLSSHNDDMTISEYSFSETSGNGRALYLNFDNNHMVISDSTFTPTSNGAFKFAGSDDDDDDDAFYGGVIFLNNYN